MIKGGTSVNTIAADASLELDLRSVSPQALDEVIFKVLSLVEEFDQKGGDRIKFTAEVIGDRPAGEIPADHPLVKLAIECHARHGIESRLNIGSTDANEPLSRGLPAICIGLTTGGGAHSKGEYLDIPPLAQGLEILTEIVHTAFNRGINLP
jgi:acetylornithine deacetylase/succinyl-diaminopimelate desuccinylase-like protein